jgi:hypothetical protein
VVGVQPQTLAAPAPAHVSGAVQEPHESMPPQPSGIDPQFFPWAAQVVGVQPQTFAVPAPPHVAGAVHEPHETTDPQPSLIEPQLVPSPAHVFGTHGALPHTFGPPPPQTPASHAPQA